MGYYRLKCGPMPLAEAPWFAMGQNQVLQMCARDGAEMQTPMSSGGFRMGWRYCISNTNLKKTRTSHTKEVVKNYLPNFSALIVSWGIFRGDPVIAPFWGQVVFQFLIKQCMLVLEISVQGFSKALGRSRAPLGNPERMFETDEYG